MGYHPDNPQGQAPQAISREELRKVARMAIDVEKLNLAAKEKSLFQGLSVTLTAAFRTTKTSEPANDDARLQIALFSEAAHGLLVDANDQAYLTALYNKLSTAEKENAKTKSVEFDTSYAKKASLTD
jgi:hypothetical protein